MEYMTVWLVVANIALTLYLMAGIREILKKMEKRGGKDD